MNVKLTPETVEAIVNVHSFFKDYKKVYYWFTTSNLNFGGIKPIDLINRGKIKKLIEFINDSDIRKQGDNMIVIDYANIYNLGHYREIHVHTNFIDFNSKDEEDKPVMQIPFKTHKEALMVFHAIQKAYLDGLSVLDIRPITESRG